jgi:aminoethylphosphonate catabolism LysR family transcriptional regulator
MLNITHLRAFDAVAREGSFTAAARALNVTQPTLSAQVAALEERYGVRLLDRTARGVELTSMGEALRSITRRLFSLEMEAEETLAAARELKQGILKLGADGPHHIMPVLAAFTRRYPEINVSVDMGTADRILRDLREYRIDAAILARVDDDPRFYSVPFRRSPLVLFVARTHPWGRRSSVRLSEIAGERMIMREAASVTRQVLQSALDEAGIRAQSVMQIESREAVREAVAAGLGIGVVALAELDRDHRLKPLRVRDADLGIVEHIVCLAERRRLRIVRAFLEVAAAFADAAPSSPP